MNVPLHDFHSARFGNLPDAAIRLPGLNEKIDHIVGTTATLIPRETGMSLIVLSIEVGTFRLKPGDYTAGGLVAAAPADTTYNDSGNEGEGGLLLSAGDANQASAVYILPMPDELTVVGSASAVLTFWFLP